MEQTEKKKNKRKPVIKKKTRKISSSDEENIPFSGKKYRGEGKGKTGLK